MDAVRTPERIARDSTTRDKVQRRKSWQPPTLLPDPPPDSDYRYRWIRVSSFGNSDPRNVSSKLREGWELVPPDDPAAASIKIATDAKASYAGSIEIGGLALARMPEEMAKERDAYYRTAAANQVESVDNNFMRENDPRMPLLKPERLTKISS